MAVDGSRGLELARSGRYDLVLLDLRIPLVDGVEVLRDTLAHDPEQKVMVVSAIADVDSKVRCLQIGACDYLAKPFSLGELLARVRARLRDAPTPVAPPERFLRVGPTSLDLVRRKADAAMGRWRWPAGNSRCSGASWCSGARSRPERSSWKMSGA